MSADFFKQIKLNLLFLMSISNPNNNFYYFDYKLPGIADNFVTAR